MIQQNQLTTVKVISSLYKRWRKSAIDDNISLHYLINVAMSTYLDNPNYRTFILCNSGSISKN